MTCVFEWMMVLIAAGKFLMDFMKERLQVRNHWCIQHNMYLASMLSIQEFTYVELQEGCL